MAASVAIYRPGQSRSVDDNERELGVQARPSYKNDPVLVYQPDYMITGPDAGGILLRPVLRYTSCRAELSRRSDMH